MPRFVRPLVLALLAITLATGAVTLTPSARADSVKAKTLTRTEDWVVVQGKELGRLKGTHKDKLRLYAMNGGSLVPVPYQIDERTPEGAYCFDQGPADRIVKDADNGLVDDNDELVFMCKDAGDLASESSFPAGATGCHQIALKDPRTGGEAWVYLFRFDDPPARSPRRYASLERRADGAIIWKGERFYSDNAKSIGNACRLTTLKFAAPGDAEPDYSHANNVIDCSKVTLAAKKLFVTIHRDSADVRIDIGGYINGPVRVVCQNLVEIYLTAGIWISCPDSLLFLYGNATTMPTNVKLPVDLSDSEGTSWYKLLVDLSQERAKGWKFFNSKNATPVTIDGKMDETEKKLDKTWPDWNCAYGPEGAIMNRFILDPKCVRDTNELYYSDDVTEEEQPEFEPGNFGTFGFKVDLSGLKSGVYSGDYLIWYSAGPFKPGDQQKFLDITDKPLEVKVR